MEARKLVIDSTLFIEHLRAKDKSATTLSQLSEETVLFVSAVTLFELFTGASTEEKKRDVHILTDDLTVIPFDKETAFEAVAIYRMLRSQNKMLEFRDLFIAASAIRHNLELKTLNRKHFERIDNLRLA